jgi:hypothetical protein
MDEFSAKFKLDFVQRQTILLLAVFSLIIVPLIITTISKFNEYIIAQQEIQKMTLRINTLKNNPLLKNDVQITAPELLNDLEKIKELAGNYALELNGSEIFENEPMTESFSLQLRGGYLAFLRFLYAYCERNFAYRFEEIDVRKQSELMFDLKFKLQETT